MVERTLGKGEVGSSILPYSTTHLTLELTDICGCVQLRLLWVLGGRVHAS